MKADFVKTASGLLVAFVVTLQLLVVPVALGTNSGFGGAGDGASTEVECIDVHCG